MRMDMLKDKEEEKLARYIVKQITLQLLAAGELVKGDFNTDALSKKVMQFISNPKGIQFVLDHRDTILNIATNFFENKEYDFATIFYAMYFEHAINGLIAITLEKRNISKKAKNELIRYVNIRGKFTWLLELLELPAFNKKHTKVVLEAADKRNATVHYKWNPVFEERFDDEEEQKIKLLEQIRKTVTYTKRYGSKVLYENKKGKLTKALCGKKPQR